MKILVTGAKGFVGKNLVAQLKNIRDGKSRNYPVKVDEIFEYDIDSTPEELDQFCREADFVFNLAGVNRPKDQSEFMEGNFGFASTLLDTLKRHGNTCPVMISSSTQAALDNPYGESKRAGEQLMRDYAEATGARVLIYRFPNLFGKWCRPNYNSAVATFCNNIANYLPIQVNNRDTELTLLYIDDLVEEMIAALQGKEHRNGDFCEVSTVHKATLGQIVDLLENFRKMPATLSVPNLTPNGFEKKLYSTYLSYLPKSGISYPLKMNKDDRGSFTEIIRTPDRGQFSVNISKPGITKGQHWHHTKNEKFVVVKGHGLIQMRNLNDDQSAPFPFPHKGKALGDPDESSETKGRKKLWYETSSPDRYEVLKENVKKLRENPTIAEETLWTYLRNNSLDAKFRRQHIIGDYIVDFVNLETGIIIEIDGEYHNTEEQKELDEIRSNWLSSHGFSVLRFSNKEVLGDIDNVVSVIKNALKHYQDPSLGGRAWVGLFVSGENIQSVEMLPGYTHNIINLSDTEDLVTVMWCNETFDPNHPDTFFDPV